MMCLTCTLTVSSEMSRSAAMSWFRFPPAICDRTSISRAERMTSPRCSADLGRDVGRNPFVAGVNLSDRRDELLRRRALQHVAPCAGAERALHLEVPLERGEDDD